MVGLQDGSVEVRRTALEAVRTIALWVEMDADVKLFQKLMPVALQVRLCCATSLLESRVK